MYDNGIKSGLLPALLENPDSLSFISYQSILSCPSEVILLHFILPVP